jgi:hypothetical protein
MKWKRVFPRLALLSLAAAVFVALTEMYAALMEPPVVSSHLQAARLHRRSEPQVSQFPEFVGELMGLALLAAGGRIVFRLRLSDVSRSEGRLTSLNLRLPKA